MIFFFEKFPVFFFRKYSITPSEEWEEISTLIPLKIFTIGTSKIFTSRLLRKFTVRFSERFIAGRLNQLTNEYFFWEIPKHPFKIITDHIPSNKSPFIPSKTKNKRALKRYTNCAYKKIFKKSIEGPSNKFTPRPQRKSRRAPQK